MRTESYVTVLTGALVLACAPATPVPTFDSAAAVASLRAADSSLSAALGAKDVARTIAFYADDATLLPVAEPLVEGRAAIERKWVEFFGIPGFANTNRLTRIEVARGGALGYTQGTYETAMVGDDGKPTLERGKYVSVWRYDAASGWRIATDISNTDTPPPLHLESKAHQGEGTGTR